MGSGKTTSFDIAHRAGVSQATVSRALRNSPLVNPETRNRIQNIAREMNYRVDRSAAGLRSQRSKTIAVLLFEDPTTDESLINSFFLPVLGHITRFAAASEYDVLVSFQQLSDDWLNEYQVSNRADGIILLGYGDYRSISGKLRRLQGEGAHFTMFGAMTPELEGHTVGVSNVGGGELATRHLIDLGRKKIAFLGEANESCPEFQQRFEGYRNALQAAGLPISETLHISTGNDENAGFRSAAKLLESGEAFDGIFAVTDQIALGVLKCLRKSGIKVPQDVSVVGFDDIPAASYFSPSLTTVRQDTRLAAKALVENLIRMINGESVKTQHLPLSLAIRGSCGGRRD
jgi:DNA-binding LacI/PurR family transcriptional regulator